MIVFFLEERSMEALLDNLLPQIIPGKEYLLIPHTGKSDLMSSLRIKLRGWNIPDTRFVIVHDQDSNDCIALKESIRKICEPYNKPVLIRIPCRELEAWYLGDVEAVEKAYSINLRKLKYSPKYSNPDDIVDPKSVVKRYIPELTQIDGAKRISRYMDIEKNNSHSFNVFVEGVRKFVE